MGTAMILFVAFVIFLLLIAAKGNAKMAREEAAKVNAMTHQDREDYLEKKRASSELERKRQQDSRLQWACGSVNAAMICPHCSTRGQIGTRIVENKRGVSGGKATAAILSGGISLLATGLARKEKATQARCGNCSSLWSF
jgi:hypothetical protein